MELIFSQYLTELIAVVSITVLTIVTPGPDFVIVCRNSLSFSRRAGVFTSLGVAAGVWVHVFYTLAGIGLILSKSILLFSIVKLLGAAYLMYLGICCLRSSSSAADVTATKSSVGQSDFKSFQNGFINNALNPKATLFTVSLFTQLVSPGTPLGVQILYGGIVSVSALLWFSLVAVFLNRAGVKQAFLRVQKYIEKAMGTVLLAFGIKVAFSSS